MHFKEFLLKDMIKEGVMGRVEEDGRVGEIGNGRSNMRRCERWSIKERERCE